MTRAERFAAEHGAMVARLVATYRGLAPEQIAAGRQWYPAARRLAAEIAGEDLSPVAVAGVIAALSPRKHWPENVAGARMFADYWRHSDSFEFPAFTFPRQQDKAAQILNGARPLDVLRGPKEVAFYRAILGDCASVPVDTHAARAAMAPDDTRDPADRRDAERARIAAAYRAAANIVGVSPRDFQSTIWIASRDSAE